MSTVTTAARALTNTVVTPKTCVHESVSMNRHPNDTTQFFRRGNPAPHPPPCVPTCSALQQEPLCLASGGTGACRRRDGRRSRTCRTATPPRAAPRHVLQHASMSFPSVAPRPAPYQESLGLPWPALKKVHVSWMSSRLITPATPQGTAAPSAASSSRRRAPPASHRDRISCPGGVTGRAYALARAWPR